MRLQWDLIRQSPVCVRPYPIPQKLLKPVLQEFLDMEVATITEKSKSPYCKPIVIVKRKDGRVRVCGDYSRVNAII